MTPLVTILFDGNDPEKLFLPLIKKLSKNSIAITNIPSFDFETENGIHVSPSLNILLKTLGPRSKRLRHSHKLISVFRNFDFATTNLPDFDLAISFLLTIWLRNELPLLDLYSRLATSLNISYRIMPLFDPLPHLVVKTESGSKVTPLQLINGKNLEDLKGFTYGKLDKAKIVEETKKTLENSDIVLLFQVSPITIYFLKSIGSLKKVLENYKGTIIYLLPQEIRDIDKKILALMGYSEDLQGLIRMAHEQVDAIIFDEKNQDLITELSDIKVTFYPAPYEFETREGMKNFIYNVLKVLK